MIGRQQREISLHTPPPPTPGQRSTPSHHRLRRTPQFSATPSPTPKLGEQPVPSRPEQVTVSFGSQGKFLASAGAYPRIPARRGSRQSRRRVSQDLAASADESSTPPPSQQPQTSDFSLDQAQSQQRSAVRISKNTYRAILYALEEGLRGPKEYTLDYPEIFAQMADISGGVPATSNGTATPMSRPIAARAPAPTGSPGIKGPRAIMQERAAREERQRLERERLEREHAEAEARAAEEALQKERERRAAAAAAAAGAGPVPSNTGVDASSTRRPAQTSADRAKADDGNRTGAYPKAPGDNQAQGAQRHTRGTSAPGAATPGMTSGNQPPPPESSTSARGSQARSAFPHAFERWESLSAHWEGLTNFWIRRLEQNAQQISNDPVSQQLARQVTDLSSAGANLFHAVVELQRLRASSERKFQRWFFETRTELERHQEVAAMLEAALEEERRTRGDAIRKALEKENGTSKLEKQLAEMRKELLISKEEARRAWEELGRREQEERDRTASLQQGHPTIVGGVQVVPMTQSAGRGDSQRDPRSYGQAEPSDYTRSPTSRAAHPEYTQAPAVQPTPASASGGGAYQSEPAVHHQQSYGSEGYSDEDFETPATQPEVYRPTGSGTHQPQYSANPDYSGAGYSSGWEEMEQMPRHHHPTRLSDVIEEDDERSRTSASQGGRV
ncbi:hypothetical protein DL766_009539 [Monosporascus sp. MC13-8B]|uniref:Uncharacterized protein n=1 Tax=Monosporascus cannonballus TaxID=155416 RepID=A0ABY0HBA3_9PEZI|nr:hypothetical protein DL762_003188 [Monosporascus cannonballus]RYO98256.1 hypothetical protein DL763_002356 [Monosporascus cannonballus]RYP14931.1 hypothetical protein DL766_009539 [Monosporascus sp. MC13-8B]